MSEFDIDAVTSDSSVTDGSAPIDTEVVGMDDAKAEPPEAEDVESRQSEAPVDFKNVPYWRRPALFPEERLDLAEKIAGAINAAGLAGTTGMKVSATVDKTSDLKLIQVLLSGTGIDGGMVIELPQDRDGVVVEFPKMRQRKFGVSVLRTVIHLSGEYGSRFVVPDSYPLDCEPIGRGQMGGAARIEALGPEGVSIMMASMREKRWGSINDMSMKMAVKFDVFGIAKQMDEALEKEGVDGYQRRIIRKRVAKMLAEYVVI